MGSLQADPASAEAVREPQLDLLLTALEPSRGALPRKWRFAMDDTIRIGRAAANDVQLDESCVSRYHGKVVHHAGQWEYVNLGSNGTLVDGRKVSTVPIRDGTTVRFSPNGPRIQFSLVAPMPDPVRDGPESRVTQWLHELRAGHDTAAQKLWDRYYQRIVRLAKERLGQAARRVSDEEDVAISVFECLFAGVSEGRFAELSSRDNLWRLLATLTSRKAVDQIYHQTRQKRGGGKVRGESVWLPQGGSDSVSPGIAQAVSDEPTPQFSALLEEEASRRLELLDDEDSRSIAEWKMEGYTNDEIAERLSCAVRTVERKLQAIRRLWADDAAQHD